MIEIVQTGGYMFYKYMIHLQLISSVDIIKLSHATHLYVTLK